MHAPPLLNPLDASAAAEGVQVLPPHALPNFPCFCCQVPTDANAQWSCSSGNNRWYTGEQGVLAGSAAPWQAVCLLSAR